MARDWLSLLWFSRLCIMLSRTWIRSCCIWYWCILDQHQLGFPHLAWTTKTLDLDSVLEQPITESQKRIWLTRAVASKAVLSLAISQFDTSKRLTTIGIGSSYTKAQFSILYDHVKDVAIRTDQSEHLLQGSTPAPHVNETQIAPTSDATGSITPKTSDPKSFINAEGQRQNFVVPPAQYKEMSPEECLAALAKIRAHCGLPPKPLRPACRNPCRAPLVAPNPANTMISYAEVASPNTMPSVMSGITVPTAAAVPPASSTNSLPQVLASNWVPLTDCCSICGRQYYKHQRWPCILWWSFLLLHQCRFCVSQSFKSQVDCCTQFPYRWWC